MSNIMNRAKDILGLNQDEIWQGIALEIGADFIPSSVPLAGTCKMILRTGELSVVLDTYSQAVGDSDVASTRFSCEVLRNGCFQLWIAQREWWRLVSAPVTPSDAEKKLRENGFLLQSNDPTVARELIESLDLMDEVINNFESGARLAIECREAHVPQDKREHHIVFSEYGVMRDAERIKRNFALVGKVTLLLNN